MVKMITTETGQISDGSHTFDELYYHRMMLFALICRAFPEQAWRSKLHANGKMYGDYFVVGIRTPEGDYSYHYHTAYWDQFDGVPILNRAPEWDGHKSADIGRLFSLLKKRV